MKRLKDWLREKLRNWLGINDDAMDEVTGLEEKMYEVRKETQDWIDSVAKNIETMLKSNPTNATVVAKIEETLKANDKLEERINECEFNINRIALPADLYTNIKNLLAYKNETKESIDDLKAEIEKAMRPEGSVLDRIERIERAIVSREVK